MSAEPVQPSVDRSVSRWYWPAFVVGWVGIAFGIHSVYRHPVGLRTPSDLALWLAGGVVAHDAIWAPIAVALGLVSARFLAPWLRAPVRVALALSALLVLASRPVVARYGARPDNPSVDPRNSGRWLLAILVAIWTIAIGRAVVHHRRASEEGP